MSTMEHLFMQIFDRKRWIEGQFKHQVESYGQSLASNLLAEGHRLPPWLCTSGSNDPGWPDTKELDREQIITEILDPLPRVSTSANSDTFFILPTLKGSNFNLLNSDRFFTKTRVSNKCFEVNASDEMASNDVLEGSKRNSEKTLEPEVTENYSESSQPTKSQTSIIKHKEADMPPSKKAKTENYSVQENTLIEFTGRVARSMSTCLNDDYIKDHDKATRSRSVERNTLHEFTGRVTRSMATRLNDDCIKDHGKITRSSFIARKYHSVGQSKLAKSQKGVLSAPSASIYNDGCKLSAADDHYIDPTCAGCNSCPLTNSLASRLSAITLLSEPEHRVDGIEGCCPNASALSTFEVENHESTDEASLSKLDAAYILSGRDSSPSTQLNEDFLCASGTIRRIEEADRDATDNPFVETHEAAHLECDSLLRCKSSALIVPSSNERCQSFEHVPLSSFSSNSKLNDFSGNLNEPQVGSRNNAIKSSQQHPAEHCSGTMLVISEPDLDVVISNNDCNLSNNSVAASVKESQNGLEASLVKFNSVLKDGSVPRGSKSADNTLKHREINQEDVLDTVMTVFQREAGTDSNGGPKEVAQLPGGNSVCITLPASSPKDCWIFENTLLNSSPERDCILYPSPDNSSHSTNLNDNNRKNRCRMRCTEEVECSNPTEVSTDVAVAEKSEDSYPVEMVHLLLNRIEECDSRENFVSNSAKRLSADGQDDRSDLIGTQDWGYHSHYPVCNANASLPAISPSEENDNGKRDTKEMGTGEDRIIPDAKRYCQEVKNARYLFRSSTSLGKINASLVSSRIDDSDNLWQVDHAYDITWPERKKKKRQSTNILAICPRLRFKTRKDIEEDIGSSCRESLHNASECIDFQPFMLSHEMKVESSEEALGQFEEEHISKKCRVMEGDHDLEGKCRPIRTPLSIKYINEYLDLTDEDKSAVTESNVLNLEQSYISQGEQNTVERFEHRSPIKSGSFEESADVGHAGGGSSYSHDSAGLSQQYDNDLVGLEETIPVFEGLNISVSPVIEDEVIFGDSEIHCLSKERASLLQQLCRSGNTLATKSCSSLKYNAHKLPDGYHSLPADILERLNLSNCLHIDCTDVDQFRTRKDDETTDPCCSLESQFDGSLLISNPYSFPSSNVKYAREAGKPPLTPPVEKLQERMISRKSIVSSEELGSNPELVCFRIDENSSITEEPTSEQGVGSRGVWMSRNRTILADVTSVYLNVPTSVSVCGKYPEQGNLDSANTMSRLGIDYKENDILSVGQSSIKSAKSFCRRVNKANFFGKTIERNRGKTVSEKWGKPDNIISNISSFIPHVREKQQMATPGTGKRGIKVKAPEATEAAKHLGEKRNNDREARKAAPKLERVRLEQENVRQLEIKQKQKEELRKKREEDFESRKRQREIEKREKERKRRCTEEARKRQRVHVEKLHIEKGDKELRDKHATVKKRKGNELSKEAKKQAQLAKGGEIGACRNASEVKPSISKAVTGDPGHVSNCVEVHGAYRKTNDYNEVVKTSYQLQNAIQDRMSVTTESRYLQLYEITPYKDSDDEDGDDNMRKRKHIPSWARRESLDQILLSNCHLDPVGIFSRKSSFDLIEVLLPKVHRRPPP